MSNSVLYDDSAGSYATARQHGPTVWWQDSETRGKMYKQVMRQLATEWAALSVGTTGPSGGWLVEESQPKDCPAGLLEWERIYAFLPPTRTTGDGITYNLQFIGTDITDLPITTTALTVHEWWHTSDPTIIPVLRAFKAVKVGSAIKYMGTQPPAGATWILAEDSRLRNWRGNFYERTTPYIRLATLATV